jgi:two-component system chemotaxis sensor kinase CheA
MNENIIQKFRDKFIDESVGLLDQMEKDLLELEKSPQDRALLESAFRAMHTIKGVSGMYGFDFICEFTHILENIYQSLRENKVFFNKEISDLSFAAIDHIRRLLEDEKLKDEENKERHKKLTSEINELAKRCNLAQPQPVFKPNEKSEKVKTKKSWYIILNTNEQMFFRGINLTSLFKELSQLGEYHIQPIPVLGTQESDSWGIVLVSDCTENDIRDVFIYIEDDIQVFRITSNDIFHADNEPKINFEPKETEEIVSIIDLVENPEKAEFQPAAEKLGNKETEIIKSANLKLQTKRIAVDSVKLDHLMYLVSELITINSQLVQATKGSYYAGLQHYVEQVDSLSKQFRNNALEIRLVPLNDLALRFQRLIRDLSSHLGKTINFTTEGLETELDKSTIDILAEPLMHLIRNCIDHGIESPETRAEIGKPEKGTIKLSAVQSGSYILISISDDGSGIDAEKVKQKAIEKGIIGANDNPSDKELYDFIFLPGFSTAKSLTDVSGRGVGMDVVKKKITDLRGEIIVESKKNVGTTFTLKIQQSIAIIDTLLFKVENSSLIVPMSDIEICIQMPIQELDTRRNTETIEFNERLIKFYDLRQMLNLSGQYKENVKFLIIRREEQFVAIMADRIIGEHQAVLKPLGNTLKDQNLFSAASQLGDGNLAFLLDTSAFDYHVREKIL